MEWRKLALQHLDDYGMSGTGIVLLHGVEAITKAQGFVINAETCEIRGSKPHKHHDLLLPDVDPDTGGRLTDWVKGENDVLKARHVDWNSPNHDYYVLDPHFRLAPTKQQETLIRAAKCVLQLAPDLDKTRVEVKVYTPKGPPLSFMGAEVEGYILTWRELADGAIGEPAYKLSF